MSLADDIKWSDSARSAARTAGFQVRMDKLIQTFLSLKPDMELRRYMLTLVRNRGFYCRTCSPMRKIGACGPTCPMLRPGGWYQYRSIDVAASETWCRDSLDILRRYKVITDGLKRHGYGVSMSELAEWEFEADDMQWRDVDELASRHLGEPFSIGISFVDIEW
ncbi:hypothetical protein DE146DRAFT_340865 [Phaeosphaeria sp. MPI-PUGE-AT-0046c]|nr:hypothetical protein DE146DRAFT_340865 [Phaeosphaeria sp. MPI-PUGE-AT-0046c]